MTDNTEIDQLPIARRSKLAITAFVLGILSLFLSVFVGIPSLIFGFISLAKIKKSNGALKGRKLAIAGIVFSCISLLLAVLFVFWGIDAAPIPNDYTIASLHSADKEYDKTYELLTSFADDGDPNAAVAIGLTKDDVETIDQIAISFSAMEHKDIAKSVESNRKDIIRIWANAEKGRDIINQLSEYEQIADLITLSFGAEIKFLMNMRRLCELYTCYICLQCQDGQSQLAAEELIRMDSVFRKLSINSRSTILKLVCYGQLGSDIRAANFIINKDGVSKDTIRCLSGHFTPLTAEQTSLRNPFIAEYLTFEDAFGTYFRTPSGPMLKKNSSFRLCRNYYDGMIAKDAGQNEPTEPELSVWPGIYSFLPEVSISPNAELPWYYTCYNPIGSFFIAILTPTMDTILKIKTKILVQDDLFQIVLAKRLGRSVNLKARAYSDEYVIDIAGEIIYSPGFDGQVGTDDDIKLAINPKMFDN